MIYRTLVIAPRTNLVLVEDEVTAVVNSLHANLLQGVVTANQVLDKISEGWDIIWFMTHGTEEGIMLSDGPLSAASLTTFIRTAEARLVVLNTCESIGVALDIHNELLTNLVCTLRELPDREAFFTGKQLSLHLARGKSFSQSYLAAKPGQNQNYIFLVGKERDSPVATIAPLPPTKAEGGLEYTKQIERLDALVSGNALWGQEGLVNIVRSLLKEVADIKRAVLVLQIGGVAVLILTFIILVTVVSLYMAKV